MSQPHWAESPQYDVDEYAKPTFFQRVKGFRLDRDMWPAYLAMAAGAIVEALLVWNIINRELLS